MNPNNPNTPVDIGSPLMVVPVSPYDLTQSQFETHKTERIKALCNAVASIDPNAIDPNDYTKTPLQTKLALDLQRILNSIFSPMQ